MAGFKSILNAIAHAPVDVLKWMATPKGKAAVGIIEAGIEIPFPLLTGAINIFNTFAGEAVKVETLAVAAGSSEGNGTEKAAAVINDVTPEVLAFAEAHGLQQPTADEIKKMNDLAVEFLNLFKPKSSATPALAAAAPHPAMPVAASSAAVK